ncbi:cobaltochelatase subunit CobN [Nitrosomonas sp.]|uniref:cobaltochelatase subunit CobN n=1 Tax=Nitrosomonas sp. TaxID=42353 RepID=UPI002621D76D|nr:cobaltochelatase subunit CobN [Nitrosomonas sp.]
MKHMMRYLRLFALACLFALTTDSQANSLLFLTANPMPAGKYLILDKLAKDQGIETHTQYVEKLTDPIAPDLLARYDWVILDAPRDNVLRPIESRLSSQLASYPDRLILMHEEHPRWQGVEDALAQRLHSYFVNGGLRNLELFMQTLVHAEQQQDWAGLPEPWVFPEAGIYHPDYLRLVLPTTEEFLAFKKYAKDDPRPLIGITMQRQYLASGQTALIDELVRRIEANGAIAMPMYGPIMSNDAIEKLARIDDTHTIDVLINTQIVLNADGRRAEFTRLGIPVIQGTAYRSGDEAAWRADPSGMPLMDVPFYMAQAEYTGISDILIAAGQGEHEQLPITEQTTSLANKALRLAHLARAANADKQLALFVWNTPPGEKNFAGSYLNLPRSLIATLSSLQDAGYDTAPLPEEQLIERVQRLLAPNYQPVDDKQVLSKLLDDNLAARLPVADYQHWFDKLPQQMRDEMIERWGAPQDSSMMLDGHFVIPRLTLGKLVLLPQPPRSERGENKEKALYHSPKAVPSHFYLAAYLWVREQYRADALIHYGTHGSQEWLPGKERGLSINDYPYLALGDLPVIYPYIMDNIGEATQARRRGRATTISYQTPPFSPAGLHTTLNELHDLLHQWQMQELGAVKDNTRLQLIDKVIAENIDKDLDWSRTRIEDDFPAFIEELHQHLHDLAQTAQPVGLHTFGEGSEADWRITSVMLMLGVERLKSLAAPDEDADEQLAIDHQQLRDSPLFKRIKSWLEATKLPDDLNATEREIATLARDYYQRMDPGGESRHLLDALAGRYVPTSYGGDPVKNPDALPSGRNLYAFDPSRIPTEAAWKAGQQAFADLLAAHREQSGQMPEKLTFSLWSVETMRHYGVLEAQAFAALGVRPVWDDSGRVSDVALIPRSELGRPRVDVVLSATGLYRDQFPNVIRLLAKAVKLAAEAEEADNPVRTNAQRITTQLLARGLSEVDARDAGQTRIFASASGQYGTGLDNAALATDSWQDQSDGDRKMAEMYLDRSQHAYGPDESKWGRAMEQVNLYAEHLKGTQGAVLARSSNLYGMLTTDDPFQYLGGISQAVRYLDGKAPELYISNLRGGGSGKVEGAARFLASELTTRNFHPGYIKNLMDEGYSGTLEIVDSLNNFTGWQNTAREIVRSDQWQSFADIYVKDKYQLGLDQWFEQHNPHAQAQAIERILEAARQGYWEASEADLKILKDRYQDLAQRYDVHSDNQAFTQYLNNGFGEQPQAQTEATASEMQSQTVEGMRLTKIEQLHSELSPQELAWLLILLAITGGIWRGLRSSTPLSHS